MFNIYTILIPILILAINYYFTISKPKKISEYVNLILKTLPYEFGYLFFLYFIDTEKYIDIGWSFFSFMFFLLFVTAIVLVLKIFFWVRNKKNIKL